MVPAMNATERIAAVTELGSRLEALRGKKLNIVELVSWRPGSGFERHSTVKVEFSFMVEDVAWQMSGGHFTLRGRHEECFMVGTTCMSFCSFEAASIVVEERYGDGAERRCTINSAAN